MVERFPNAVPIADGGFEQVPMTSELVFDLKQLPMAAREDLVDLMFSPRFARQRQQSSFCDGISRCPHIQAMYRLLRQIPREQQPFAVEAASIISNLDPLEIADEALLDLTQSERDLVSLSINSVYASVPTVTFESSGRLHIEWCRPQIPPTIIRHFRSEPLVAANRGARARARADGSWFAVHRTARFVNGRELPPPAPSVLKGLSEIGGFYSPDISNGFNRRNGLPDVPCHNAIDHERPPIIRWVSDLAFARPADDLPGCGGHHGCSASHRGFSHDGRPTLTYSAPGRIDLADLASCAPIIFECNRNCRCDAKSCANRAVQNRWTARLIVVRTESEFGWAVRTLDFIPAGAFVCEYLGLVMKSQRGLEAAVKASGQGLQPRWCNLDAFHVSANNMLILETREHGNVSTFMEPKALGNLLPVSICVSTEIGNHRIALFAARAIFPNEELNYHPNCEFNWSRELDKVAQKPVYGGV